jgi:hypothetical protein
MISTVNITAGDWLSGNLRLNPGYSNLDIYQIGQGSNTNVTRRMTILHHYLVSMRIDFPQGRQGEEELSGHFSPCLV